MTSPQEQLVGLYKNIAKVIVGKHDQVLLTIATLLCRGHLLIEDAPGLGKTMLARSLVRSLNMDFNRVQCTPDLLPSDITGVSIYNQKTSEFEFRRGPVFTNVLLADEINRATPRTQSSLLECMAESQVTVDGTTYPMADIFMVMATQNPVEYQGTYPLPEAQLDRFFMRLSLGYPKLDEEMSIMAMQMDHHPIQDLQPVMEGETLRELQARAKAVHMDESVRRYIAQLVQASREHPDVALGASPRGSLALMKAAQAMALMGGKDFVDPQTVKKVAIPVLAHRLIPKPQLQVSGRDGEAILRAILNEVPVPVLEA
jgi:MoxR-like ATPase